MYLNTYEDRDGWWVYKSRRTLAFRFWYNFEPAGFRGLELFLVGGFLGGVLSFVALPEMIGLLLPWYASVVSTLLVAIGTVVWGKHQPTRRSIRKLKREGLLVRQDSYALKRLNKHLADLKIWIHHMNDECDHEVGMVPIHLYLKEVAEPSRLIDSGHLKKGDEESKAQHAKLKEEVDAIAHGAATTIRYLFDQRELERQALEAGESEKAATFRRLREERLAAIASGEAEVWLITKAIGA